MKNRGTKSYFSTPLKDPVLVPSFQCKISIIIPLVWKALNLLIMVSVQKLSLSVLLFLYYTLIGKALFWRWKYLLKHWVLVCIYTFTFIGEGSESGNDWGWKYKSILKPLLLKALNLVITLDMWKGCEVLVYIYFYIHLSGKALNLVCIRFCTLVCIYS